MFCLPKVNYINKEGLINLKNYKYVSGTYSFMDHALTPFWNKVTEFFPLWLAPNTITLIGTIGLLVSALTYLPYDITMTQEFNSWCYLFTALALFGYQTLDACDGKQARRTGSSSPLGQLFDHGCDAIATVIIIFFVI